MDPDAEMQMHCDVLEALVDLECLLYEHDQQAGPNVVGPGPVPPSTNPVLMLKIFLWTSWVLKSSGWGPLRRTLGSCLVIKIRAYSSSRLLLQSYSLCLL